MNLRSGFRLLALSALASLISGCGTVGLPLGKPPLRVGVTPDYPPIIFRNQGMIAGVEADLALGLGRELGREVDFVELPWDKQVTALLENHIDIIMSGMSITPTRKVRIQFSAPYLETGLMAMVRRKHAGEYTSRDKIVQCGGIVGFQQNTTAESFVREHFQSAAKRSYLMAVDAALEVQRNRIDMVVHDGPAIAWLASQFESELAPLMFFLDREQLAWGLRRDDPQLLQDVNAALAKWKSSGTLDAVLDRWLPYRDSMQEMLNEQ